jgi:hypothetical protein
MPAKQVFIFIKIAKQNTHTSKFLQFMKKFLLFLLVGGLVCPLFAQQKWMISDKGYFEQPGVNVTVFADIYPDGHQTGVTIIQHGQRVAANGDIRLEISPGQWSPMPKGGSQTIDKEKLLVSQSLWFPDTSKNRVGFNPIDYPEITLRYNVKVQALEGSSFKISVDLNEPIPTEWVGKIGFNLELFPGDYFGKAYLMDQQSGIFTQQPNGPIGQHNGQHLADPLAKGKTLIVAPDDELKMIKITDIKGNLELWDGRSNHNNGWFIVRSAVQANATQNVVEWIVTPNVVKGWKYAPVVHTSQVGYHPNQPKTAVIEIDKTETEILEAKLIQLTSSGKKEIKSGKPKTWGQFLRYNYMDFDFSEVTEPGLYQISYGNSLTEPFSINNDVYKRHVWQPVLEYFLPVQMCHMRINDQYRVWHDVCHLDDALMAPVNLNHFDGYVQGASTLTKYKPLEPIHGLNEGGWHDAGDYDLRVESQIGTVKLLAMMMEEFDLDLDATTIDHTNRIVEIHVPDGKNDVIQQIEHGLKTILGGFRSLNRLYRGIICPTIRQYVLLGDGSSMTDNLVYDASLTADEAKIGRSHKQDDRWVFTEENPRREQDVAAGLALCARVLKPYNQALADECLQTALALYQTSSKNSTPSSEKVELLTELYLTTGSNEYLTELVKLEGFITQQIRQTDWIMARVINKIDNKKFKTQIEKAIAQRQQQVEYDATHSPFRVPYRPNIWGDGWTIQRFGVEQYFVNKAWPSLAKASYFMDALNFILGVHPGENTSSFASGVGSKSATVAYGVNRADWSYIPGGVISGTALIRPDLPELKVWPYFWQQTEYVLGGGSTNFMFLVLAVDAHLNKK